MGNEEICVFLFVYIKIMNINAEILKINDIIRILLPR